MQPPAVSAEPQAAPRTVVERPAHGLARGEHPFPAWGIGVLGGSLVLVGLVYMVSRIRKSRRS